MSSARAVVVGASHAGVQLVTSLRQEGWSGDIVLVGDESVLPYQRPPLSKAYLSGKCSLTELAIRSEGFYLKQGIERVDASVEEVDRSARQVLLSTGDRLSYDALALCTGARPRRLRTPGAELEGVHYLRRSSDVERIREDAIPGRNAVIVGGGYVGLETAASLRALGLDVTVLEAADRVLERVTAPEVSAFFTRIHQEEGVDVRTNASVEALVGDHRIREVVLAGGESVRADLVIIGIGIEPNTELAEAAGLVVDDGILIDAQARTSDPTIVAAGDCTSQDIPRYGRRIRLESVPSAVEQAKVAAATICGKDKEVAALPWFWSDQYDLKLQIAGLNTGYDDIVVSGGPTRDRDFTCYYLRKGEPIAADCVNRPRDFMASKRMLTQGTAVDMAALTAEVAV
ncbi:NAD(P)/FAD-dependent oxidoreductase [Nocardioides sp. T2.26MG-1]|uniref:NAD(P)/FAD-dependent oxidoreductase n=1 Tax=Nocardioides sp. T2.26MG-1 TaxID=3041166 RepID=UPI002477A7AD|nr:FAD-dependent oxidoreductase [Nocardioides sp. T2.26MG-1]CAI9406874.1 Putidaredoxin reductase CamA [Nocardioides sp. T2.26MG-1]